MFMKNIFMIVRTFFIGMWHFYNELKTWIRYEENKSCYTIVASLEVDMILSD